MGCNSHNLVRCPVSLFRYNPEIHDHPEFSHGRHGYDPNQPRVPKGHSDGGQWTNEGSGSAPRTRLAGLQSDRVVDDSGALDAWAKASPEELEILRKSLEAGSTRPDAASSRTPSTGPARPPSTSGVGRAFLPAVLLGLYEQLSDRAGADNQVVIEYRLKAKEETRKEIAPDEKFRANEYPRDKTDKVKLDVGAIRAVDRDEVEKICPRLEYVQELTDTVVSWLDKHLPEDKRGSVFGSEAHYLIKDQINGQEDPNFKAEESYYKVVNGYREKPIPPEAYGKPAPYGAEYTNRLDAYEFIRDQKRVCVYDFKFGTTRWSLRSMLEVAQTVNRNFPDAETFVMIEVKPGVSSYLRRR